MTVLHIKQPLVLIGVALGAFASPLIQSAAGLSGDWVLQGLWQFTFTAASVLGLMTLFIGLLHFAARQVGANGGSGV